MNGIILAAGKGIRFRPLTEKLPKPMLPVDSRPLLEYLIKLFTKNDIKNIAVNLFYLPDVIPNYFEEGERWGVKIKYSFEEKLLGTAGGAKKCFSLFQEKNNPVLIMYGDNITNLNLKRLIKFHKRKTGLATIVVYKLDDVSQSGIIKFEKSGLITKFLEKPSTDVFSHWVNAGIYVLEPAVFDYIPENKFYDFGHDFFPKLLKMQKKIFAYKLPLDSYYNSLDNLICYRQIKKDVKSGKLKGF